ncbi:MAG: hypothetical protein JSU98_10185 [Gemmatimonadales bacterium]|nr:MAG: hypothetical protein JSU98_10185 [Gemmatimonadales bacterium]
MSFNCLRFVTLAAAVGVTGCASSTVQAEPPRTIVIQSGERLTVERERMTEILTWVQAEIDNIEQDPTFLIDIQPASTDVYPWETLTIEGDTARVQARRTNPDLASVYQIYAHLHLMREMGRIEEWLVGGSEMDEWEFEQQVVERLADAWLLGRASYGFVPSRLMDEVMYAKEAGQLEAMLLTIRGFEFPEQRDAWLAARPGADDRFREWYRETFGRELETRL